ncbi:MAG: hopanoid biosynthesis-associated protein HpnK [Verrucomicrobiota bacterium]|nr:hopanoid biosynthesis-associated protein HpnK [Verrucomicrobiota bacterium]
MELDKRRLIVNADDFGRSREINHAVIRAHREGILTTASLMVTGEAFDEAVTLARANPTLGVGLHLTLVCGVPVLDPREVPMLVRPAVAPRKNSTFLENPVTAGITFFFNQDAKLQVEREIEAQFTRFYQTGLPLDHVNGHLHFHLHPTVLDILLRRAAEWGIKRMRLTRDLPGLSLMTASGRICYRLSHTVIFGILAAWSKRKFKAAGILHTDQVFGLLQDTLVDAEYIQRLLPLLPEGISELYSHPSTDLFVNELEGLVAPGVLEMVKQEGIELIRYQDLG